MLAPRQQILSGTCCSETPPGASPGGCRTRPSLRDCRLRRIGGEGEADLNQRVGRDGFQSEVGGLEGETFVQHEPDIFLITLAAVVPEAGERFNRQLSPSDFQRAGQLGRLGRLVPGVRHWPAPANFLRLIMGQGWLDLFREASRLSARAALRDNCLSSRAKKNYSLDVNPVAIITGASRGIGRGIALELARLGYDLVINYASNTTAAQQTSMACTALAMTNDQNIRAEICPADIGNTDGRARLIDFARSRFERLDLLVNNAGLAPETRADLLETTEASYDRLMSVNAKGPFFLTQLAARWMIELAGARPMNAPKAKIITVSSISAYTASMNRAEYCVSKAALSMLTPLFAARLAEHGINVYEIRPGLIATDMTAPVKETYDQLIAGGLTPIQRWGKPGDVAKAVAAIAQGAFPFSTGEVINVDGGFHLRRL